MAVSFPKVLTVNGVQVLNVQYPMLDHTRYAPGDDSGQRLGIIYPTSPASAYDINRTHPTRYAYIVHIIQSNFGSSANDLVDTGPGSITTTTGVDWQLLANGVAVVNVQISSPLTTNGSVGPDSGGAQVPTGRGYFHAPGGVNGYYESRNRPSGFKDVIMAVQFLQYYAARYGLEKQAWGIEGDSSGMHNAGWVAFAPNRAGEMGYGAQGGESTVPRCVYVSRLAIGWFGHYSNTALNIFNLFPKGEIGGAGTDDTKTVDLDSAPKRYKTACSLYSLLSQPGSRCFPHTVWASLTPAQNRNFSEPFIEGTSDQVHTSYFGYLFRNISPPGQVNLIVGDSSAVTVGGQAIDPVLYDKNLGADDGAGGLIDPTIGSVTYPGAHGFLNGDVVDDILGHIHDQPWDAIIPDGGIKRRNQVNTGGRIIVPLRRDRRWVELSTDGPNDLCYGDTFTGLNGFVEPGQTKIVRSSGNLCAAARAGGEAISRYIATEVPL